MELNQIGYFQFNNLIHGRVPFLLVNLGVDLSVWYKGYVATHLDAWTLNATSENALQLVKEKNLPPHFAIVVLDQDGSASIPIAQALEAQGYINAYSIEGGFHGLEKEKNSAATSN